MSQASNKRNTSRYVFELTVENLTGDGKHFSNEERHNFVVFFFKCSFCICFNVACRLQKTNTVVTQYFTVHNYLSAFCERGPILSCVCHSVLLIYKFFSRNICTCTNFTFLFSLSERPYRSFQSFTVY